MAGQLGTLPSEADFKFPGDTYGLSLVDGVEFLLPGSSIMSPPPGKMGVYYLETLDAGLCLPLT